MTNRIFEQSPQRLVLVIDDDKDIREMLQMVLVQSGYAVAAASSVEEATKFMNVSMPSVVVLDYLMPCANSGSALAKTTHAQVPDAAKILMTCVPDAHEIAQNLGIEYSIQKPFDPYYLVSMIRETIAEKFPD